VPGTKRIRGANRLTALQVKNASVAGVLEDGVGLRLFINEAGQKHWIVRVSIDGRRIARGLGAYPEVSLQNARDRADEIRRGARHGEDTARIAKIAQHRRAMTFRDAFV
jgi:hypothetical protein